MGPSGSKKKFKTLLLQIAAESFQTSPEFSSPAKLRWGFLKSPKFLIFNDFFFENFKSQMYSMEKPKPQ